MLSSPTFDFAVAIGGAASRGIATPGDVLARIFVRRRQRLVSYNAPVSRSFGVNTIFLTLRVSNQRLHNHGDKLDLLVGLNQRHDGPARADHGTRLARDLQQGEDCRQYAEDLLGELLPSHGSGVDESHIHMLKGGLPIAIPAFAGENGVDLIGMGAVARSGLSGMVIGNTAGRISNAINCPALAVKPDRFVSPIKAGEYIDVFRACSNED